MYTVRQCRLQKIIIHCNKYNALRSLSNVKWTTNNVRSTFINYFVDKHQHEYVQSSSVKPSNDPTLLFTNAGMNQFKDIFLGKIDANSSFFNLKSAVNSQKCIRAGGKHNDLDDVGADSYHHTFFEMLGTWAFDSYYKEKTIDYAYDLLVNIYKLPKEHLYVSYYGGDKSLNIGPDLETKNFWLKYFPEHKILPFGTKDNFWEMGDVGPCGPCTEIHFDRLGYSRGANEDVTHLVNSDDPNMLEIWNLVFMQYYKDEAQQLVDLPAKHVDTGMGLERLVSILQGKPSNYDTDCFASLFDAIYRNILSSNPNLKPYNFKYGKEDLLQGNKDTAYRIIADHARTTVVSIADGILPSNEGRGYVLRRIIRRALRYGVQTLQAKPGFFASVLPTVIEELGDIYPNMKANKELICTIASEEENSFYLVLQKGTKEFYQMVQLRQKEYQTDVDKNSKEQNHSLKVFSGKDAFNLHDSLGFPIDLTIILANEIGLTVDLNAFEEEMLQQRNKSSGLQPLKSTVFDSNDASVAWENNIQLNGYDIANLKSNHVELTDDLHKYNCYDTNFVSNVQAVVLPKKSGETNENYMILYPGSGEPFSAIRSELESSGIDINSDGSVLIGLVLNRSNFYSEAGGQVSDRGLISISTPGPMGHSVPCEVLDVQKLSGYVLHTCRVRFADLHCVNDNSKDWCMYNTHMSVDKQYRDLISINHSTTHVLNSALREVLNVGNGTDKAKGLIPIEQKGSLVNDTKLRFDYSIKSQPTLEQWKQVEQYLDNVITNEVEVQCVNMSLKEAMSIPDIKLLTDEIYPDPVRVVSMTRPTSENTTNDRNCEFKSIELCGGLHVSNSKEIRKCIIVEEGAIAKGVRRIVCVTHDAALKVEKNNIKCISDINKLVALCQTIELEQNIDHSKSGDEDQCKHQQEARLVEFETKLKGMNNYLMSNSSDVEDQLGYVAKMESRLVIKDLLKRLLDIKEKILFHDIEVLISDNIKRYLARPKDHTSNELNRKSEDRFVSSELLVKDVFHLADISNNKMHGVLISNQLPRLVGNSNKGLKHMFNHIFASELLQQQKDGPNQNNPWNSMLLILPDIETITEKNNGLQTTSVCNKMSIVSYANASTNKGEDHSVSLKYMEWLLKDYNVKLNTTHNKINTIVKTTLVLNKQNNQNGDVDAVTTKATAMERVIDDMLQRSALYFETMMHK